jgi:hypothetical protein
MVLTGPESGPMNFLHRLGNAYFEPAETFRVKPAWLAIFLISAVLSVAGEYVANLRVDMAGIARKSLESMPVAMSTGSPKISCFSLRGGQKLEMPIWHRITA